MTESTVTNWELNRTSPALRFLPSIITLLGFDPRPGGTTLGQQLVACRTAGGLSRDAAARVLGVDPSTLWRWESGSDLRVSDREIEDVRRGYNWIAGEYLRAADAVDDRTLNLWEERDPQQHVFIEQVRAILREKRQNRPTA